MKVQGTLARMSMVGLCGLFGAVAAFATIAPSPQDELPPATRLVTEDVAIRLEPARLPGPKSYVREERFQRGDTLSSLLARLGIADAYAQRLLRAHALTALRPGYAVTAEISAGGEPLALTFLTAQDRLVHVTPTADGFRAGE